MRQSWIFRVTEEFDWMSVGIIRILTTLLGQWIGIHTTQHVLISFILLVECADLFACSLRAEATR
jgi:hypothetical protein